VDPPRREISTTSEWGQGFFRVNENVEVRPEGADRPNRPGIDLHELLGQLLRRGVSTPILLRFDGILRARVRAMFEAFNNARREFSYEAPYCGVYPIKVNQERHVVEALLQEGANHGLGLEVGSKPELIAVIALQAGRGSLMICNGYKDEEYIEMALPRRKLGITPIIVVEEVSESRRSCASRRSSRSSPAIGIRTKPRAAAIGPVKTPGRRSKFGISDARDRPRSSDPRARRKLPALQPSHSTSAARSPEIRSLRETRCEATTHTLVGLHKMGVKIRWF
jgi:arginine decarboxylase